MSKNYKIKFSIILIFFLITQNLYLFGQAKGDEKLPVPQAIKLSKASEEFSITDGKSLPFIYKQKDKQQQPFILKVMYAGDSAKVKINISDNEPINYTLKPGNNELEIPVNAVNKETQYNFSVEYKGKIVASHKYSVEPARKMTIYILPHSHTDIGYTDLQPAIAEKQIQNLVKGIALAKKTEDYPYEARFIWNVEVAWAADLYLKRMNEFQRNEFFEAVKKGQVALNGMYLNELTGLCRPEELTRLFKFSTELENKCGVTIDAAMTSDVPGQTWGTVTAMAQAGIKYFSTAPNMTDRIGDIHIKWDDKPFYWTSASGNEKVLTWAPFKGYGLAHIIGKLSSNFVFDYLKHLADINYPYDITYIRWGGHGDNAEPDPEICEFVKDWNTKYEFPEFIISSTSEAFHAFENKYGKDLPVVKGDWTPYWEDGAGSSANETAINRRNSDRLSQAETLWAMQSPATFPASEFEDAWKNVLLYSEHTWGAWCSVSDPENKMTKEQWNIKQAYAIEAEKQSKELLNKALNLTQVSSLNSQGSSLNLYVFNTTSWLRTELITVPKDISLPGDLVKDNKGNKVPSQRLSSGELVFIVKDILPYSSQQFTVMKGNAFCDEKVNISANTLDNHLLKVRINEKTGGISELFSGDIKDNLADVSSGYDLNDYVFLPGNKLSDLQKNGQVKISVKEKGPLVASYLIESDAPSCKKLYREVRLTAGMDYVELINTLDKSRAAISDKPGDKEFANSMGKESVNFAFPFNVKNGVMRLDVPYGVMQPEKDQLPGSCKNWLPVSRWADVSNDETGITCATLDAPVIEVGGIYANMPGHQLNPETWRKHIAPTQTLFSWALNNHWGTNYRAYQDGLITLRYALRPHRQFTADAPARFATALSQPLIIRCQKSGAGSQTSDLIPSTSYLIPQLLTVQPENIIVSSFKPTDDGKGYMITLFNCSDKTSKAKINFNQETRNSKLETQNYWISDTGEKRIKETGKEIEIPAWDTVMLRVDE